MIGMIVRWLPPALLATVPLLRWGEDFRFSRFVLLLAAAALATLLRPRRAASRRALALLAAGPLLAAAAWAADGFSMLGLTAVAELGAAMLVFWAIAFDHRPADFAYLWVAAVTGAAVYGILQVVGVFTMPLDAYAQADAASTFGLSNFAAEALVLSIPLTLALFLRTDHDKLRLALPAAGLLQLIYLFVTHARAGWLGLTAAFAVGLLFWRPAERKLYQTVAAVALLFVAGYAVMGGPRLNLFSEADPSLQFRREAWKAAAAMTADAPLLGHGPGRFPSYVADYSSERLTNLSSRIRRSVHHPHNEFLLASAERGTLSLLWLLTGLGALGWYLYHRNAAWPLAGLAGALVTATVGFPFQQAYFWIGLPLLVALAAPPEDEEDETAPSTAPGLFTRVTATVLMLALALPFTVRAIASNHARQGIAALESARRTANRDNAEIMRARAAESLRRSLQYWPYDPEAILNAATAAPAPKQRAEWMQKYLRHVPGDMLARVALAQAQEAAGAPADAEATLRALLLDKKAPAYAYHRLIEMLVRRQRLDEAARIAEDGVAKFGDDVQLLVDAGDTYRLQEKYDQAAGFYERALQKKTDEAGLYLRAGIAYLAGGQYPEAQAAFQRGHELSPNEPVYLVYLARLNYAADRTADAKTNLLQALKYDPDLANNLKESAPELLPLLKNLK